MPDILLPRPPRDSGWDSDELDMYDLPDHVELIYGALELMMSPQRAWHDEVIFQLRLILRAVIPDDLKVRQEMTVRVDKKSRPEPDLLVYRDRPDYTLKTKWFRPEDVVLAAEVESPESEARDRELKPLLYSKAEIPHYLRVVESESGLPVLYHYRLKDANYELVSEHEARLVLDEPFAVDERLKGF
jgi:Uma2 family endonuclease